MKKLYYNKVWQFLVNLSVAWSCLVLVTGIAVILIVSLTMIIGTIVGGEPFKVDLSLGQFILIFSFAIIPSTIVHVNNRLPR